MRLDGKTALITGGTQGVGAAIAERLARAGCNLVLHGLQDDELCKQTVARCKLHGVRVSTAHVDLSQATEAAITQLISAIDLEGTDVSLLVNNAGTFCDQPFLEMDHSTFEKTMRLNVYAGYFLTQVFARRWIARQMPGRVLFTGSINGELAEADHTAYDTSKGAVHAMVRSLCVALAPHGIRVNALAPGLVITPLTAPAIEEDTDVLEWMKLHTPNRSVPGPEACAAAALFLLSDEAEHIHGQTLLVDGGMSAWQQPDLPNYLRGHLSPTPKHPSGK